MERTDAVRWAAGFGPGGDALAGEDVVGIPGTAGPIALFAIRCWLRSPHAFLPGVLDAISAGGDTDTAAAVTGGLLGTSLGASRSSSAVLAPDPRRGLRWRRGTHATVRGCVGPASAVDAGNGGKTT